MSVTPDDLKDFAAVVLHHYNGASTVILSSKESLLEASVYIEDLENNLLNLPS